MIIKTNCKPEDLIKACELIKETKPHMEDVLNFYEKIFILQAESFDNLHIKPVLISEELLQTKLTDNFPLITMEEFSIDFTSSEALFKKICHLYSDHKIKNCDSIFALVEMIKNNKISYINIATKFLYNDDEWLNTFSKKNNIEKSNLESLLYNSLKPSIEQCSIQIASYLDNTPGKTQLQGYCPICGSYPGISLLSSENGARSLVCSFCWHEWEVQRIFCPFCGTTDTKKLSYLKIEGESGLRGDVCDNCSKYIKTIDLREYKNDIYLPLELLAAIPLDIRLEQEGYISGGGRN